MTTERTPTTLKGHALLNRLGKPRTMPDPEVDWSAWIADIEAEARAEPRAGLTYDEMWAQHVAVATELHALAHDEDPHRFGRETASCDWLADMLLSALRPLLRAEPRAEGLREAVIEYLEADAAMPEFAPAQRMAAEEWAALIRRWRAADAALRAALATEPEPGL